MSFLGNYSRYAALWLLPLLGVNACKSTETKTPPIVHTETPEPLAFAAPAPPPPTEGLSPSEKSAGNTIPATEEELARARVGGIRKGWKKGYDQGLSEGFNKGVKEATKPREERVSIYSLHLAPEDRSFSENAFLKKNGLVELRINQEDQDILDPIIHEAKKDAEEKLNRKRLIVRRVFIRSNGKEGENFKTQLVLDLKDANNNDFKKTMLWDMTSYVEFFGSFQQVFSPLFDNASTDIKLVNRTRKLEFKLKEKRALEEAKTQPN